jgi:hypothetical protein
MPSATGSDVMTMFVTVPSVSDATMLLVATRVSVEKSVPPQSTTTSALPGPVPKVWPVLTLPNVFEIRLPHVKSS